MAACRQTTGANMTTKLILAFAVAAFTLAGGSLAMAGNASAKNGWHSVDAPHGMRMSNDFHRENYVRRDREHRDGYREDREHDRSFVFRRHDHDHSRHFWHDRWWDYGIGPCWRWVGDYDEYVWVCD